MLDKLPIKAAASVEKKTSSGFSCRRCVCKSLRAHDLLAVSCFQLAKWCKVIGLHALTTTLPPSLICVIFLPPSCSDRVSPACTSLFQLRGSRCRVASCTPCSRQGQGWWQIPASIMERDFGSGKKQTLCIPWDISEVMDGVEEEQFCPWVATLNLVAAFCAGRGLIHGAESCCCITWGQTEVRVSLSMAGVPAAAALQPHRGWLGQRTAKGWAPLVHVRCHRGLWSFWEQLKEENNLTWVNFWKRRQLQTSWYANACNFLNGSRRVCFFLLLRG